LGVGTEDTLQMYLTALKCTLTSDWYGEVYVIYILTQKKN
jgi:hypothetical protein